MSGGGCRTGGAEDRPRSSGRGEMIALNQFGRLDQRMDQYGTISNELDRENGVLYSSKRRRSMSTGRESAERANRPQYTDDLVKLDSPTGGKQDDNGKKGLVGEGLNATSEGRAGRGFGGGLGGGGRRRRHSEKSVRVPRAKDAIVRQISEECNGFINYYFDAETEIGLSQTIPEYGSRPSPPPPEQPPASVTEGGKSNSVVVARDLRLGQLSDEKKDGDPVQNPGVPTIRKIDLDGGDDVSLTLTADMKDGEKPSGDMALDISGLGVVDSREYSPSPGGDTQPLLLDEESSESALRIVGEILIPFLLAGFGCVFAGIVFDIVKSKPVFKEIPEFVILVPSLLGLKGNLEMTLASRLSTQANMGHMDSTSEQLQLICGNLALTQAQAIIVGLLAAIVAMILGWVPKRKFDLMNGFLLCTGSVLTAAVASFVLGSVMVIVIVLSRKLHINPDNIATPIAASLGDLVTISLFAEIAMLLFNTLDTHTWLTPLCLFSIIAMIPLWWYFSHRNRYTHDVLYTGWVPVIGAMAISSLGGLVLDYTVVRFESLAAFQPVINGVGGNLAAVQASRLSTALHKVSTPGHLPENAVHGCPNPISTFFGKSTSARTARVLMLMVVPGHVIFMFTIYFLRQTGETHISPAFASLYLTAAVMQVALLLYIANGLVHFLWKRGNDPDNASIPYLTAIGDLLGTLLLALAFIILSKTEPDNIVPHHHAQNGTEMTTITI